MKKPRITSARFNNRKREICIIAGGKELSIPSSRLPLAPDSRDPVAAVFVDPELAERGITYRLKSGKEASLHMDAFLDYNRDPDFMGDLLKYRMTVLVLELLPMLRLSKSDIRRRLRTSPSQLSRLLDPANRTKTIDQLLRVLSVIGCELDLSFRLKGWPKDIQQAARREIRNMRFAA